MLLKAFPALLKTWARHAPLFVVRTPGDRLHPRGRRIDRRFDDRRRHLDGGRNDRDRRIGNSHHGATATKAGNQQKDNKGSHHQNRGRRRKECHCAISAQNAVRRRREEKRGRRNDASTRFNCMIYLNIRRWCRCCKRRGNCPDRFFATRAIPRQAGLLASKVLKNGKLIER